MSIVAQAGERALARAGTVLPRKTPLARSLLEPPCNLAGSLLRTLFDLLPADLVLSIHDAIHRRLAGGRCYPFDADAPALARAAAEARTLEAETGKAPALLAFISHPPVLGDLGHLNFELMRHAFLALRAVRRRPCRPRLVVAVDPFALDTAGLAAEGFYAGVMGLYHLGLDRLAFTRGRLSSLILGEAAWPRLAWRLDRRLREGGEVVMSLSGGAPATARMLYTAREWIAAQRRASPLRGRPAEVLRRLRTDQGFRRFEAEGPLGPGLRRSAWRMLEGWIVSAAAGHPWAGSALSQSSAETGRLEPEAREALAAGLSALGSTQEQQTAAWAALEEEWPRETPWRRRLFRHLAGRVLARGRPLLFLPVAHRWGPRPGIVVGEAWSWQAGAAGRISGRVLGAAPRQWQGTADEFALEFGKANYA
ncbi:MAG: hypothetical protein NTY77_19605 [Elusimicrobia bacterium]|nr:hypothetical protein [Elusimicrobiota bacterium]